MSRIAVRLDFPSGFTHQDLESLTLIAEDRGYESIWMPEGGGINAVVHLTAISGRTSRIKLATGILPVFSRTATLTAMSAASLEMVSNHRFILGLGTGHREAVEQRQGLPFERPITRLRETVEICRRYLADQHVQYNGKVFDIIGNSLELGQNFPVPIYIAALGPQMLRLSGEIGDGVLLNWAAPTYLEEVNTHLATGAQLAARNHKDIDRACYIRVAVTDNPDSIKSALDQQLIRYSGMAYYHNHFVQSGFADNMDAIRHHLEKGDRQKAIAAITDEMRCQLAVFGPAEECRQEVERRRSAGVDLPVIAPFALTDVAASYRRTIEAFSD